MSHSVRFPILQETLWGAEVGGAVWPFQPLGPRYLRPLHLHGQPEFFVMRRGDATLRIGAETYGLQRGQVAWIAPGVEHVIERFSPDFDFWLLQPEPEILARSLARLEPGGSPELPPRSWLVRLCDLLPDPPVFRPTAREFAALLELADGAWRTYLEVCQEPVPDARFEWIPPWDAAARRRARERLVELCGAALQTTRRARGGRVRLARRAFDLLLGDPFLSRRSLCDELHISEGHLSRQFPALFGSNLVEQRARTRLVSFLALVKSPAGANMLSASLSAGFGSYAQLHRVFTRHSPCGPREYLHGTGHLWQAKVTRG